MKRIARLKLRNNNGSNCSEPNYYLKDLHNTVEASLAARWKFGLMP